MCGIAGLFRSDQTSIDPQLLIQMATSMDHRGPDDIGFMGWSPSGKARISRHTEAIGEPVLGFVHRRLSIIDLSETGWQPMQSADGKYSIITNGEIYNYVELRDELKKLGHSFRSTSDTEVLLTAYMAWGPEALNRLVGMFAFAILDLVRHQLILARDFFGIKPLYYAQWQHGFAFASEIKTLLDLPGVSRRGNPQAAFDYLSYGLTDHDDETMFAGIKKLPAAHYLQIPLDRLQEQKKVQYWQIDLNQKTDLSYEEAAAHLQTLFLKNVQLHLRSDVSLGAALSGGIDSSAVVTAMRHLEGSKLDLHTFSYIAEGKTICEEPWIDLVGQATDAQIHKIHPQPEELISDLEHLIYMLDEPFASTGIYAQMRVCELAKSCGIKVMLDGQGADEMLGGYRTFLIARLNSLIRQKKWREASRFLWHIYRMPRLEGSSTLSQFAGKMYGVVRREISQKVTGKTPETSWLDTGWFNKQGVDAWAPTGSHSPDALRELLKRMFTSTSLPRELRFEDRTSMASSIESRVPFLTPEIVSFIFSLPEAYIISPDAMTKSVFREAMRGIVPDPILQRRDKIGYVTPEKDWLLKVKDWVEQVLTSDAAHQLPMLNLKVVLENWHTFAEQGKPFDDRFWLCVNLSRWSEIYGVEY